MRPPTFLMLAVTALTNLAHASDKSSASIDISTLPECVKSCMMQTSTYFDYTQMDATEYCAKKPYYDYIFNVVGPCTRRACRREKKTAQYAWNEWMYELCGWRPFHKSDPPE